MRPVLRVAAALAVVGALALPRRAAAVITGGCTAEGHSTSSSVDLTTATEWHRRSTDTAGGSGSSPAKMRAAQVYVYALGIEIPIASGTGDGGTSGAVDGVSVAPFAIPGTGSSWRARRRAKARAPARSRSSSTTSARRSRSSEAAGSPCSSWGPWASSAGPAPGAEPSGASWRASSAPSAGRRSGLPSSSSASPTRRRRSDWYSCWQACGLVYSSPGCSASRPFLLCLRLISCPADPNRRVRLRGGDDGAARVDPCPAAARARGCGPNDEQRSARRR
jgi:hypothetical protein